MSGYTLSSKSFPPLSNVHQGTGRLKGKLNVIDPKSVDGDAKAPMDVLFGDYDIEVLSLETDAAEAPNWFGVSFPAAAQKFDTINLFCHPHPGHAGMKEADYASRGGDWPKLFRYAEIFGRQVAIAGTNHITVVPFFTDTTYGSTGIMKDNWLDLMEQIIVIVRNVAQGLKTAQPGPNGRTPHVVVNEINRLVTSDATSKKGAPPRATSNSVKNVVLSCFSRGRQLANTVSRTEQGIQSFLRESWDFDGVGGAPVGAPRVITYDQQKLPTGPSTRYHFHVPPERWIKYHNTVVANVHGDIPAMMAVHAATNSSVGK